MNSFPGKKFLNLTRTKFICLENTCAWNDAAPSNQHADKSWELKPWMIGWVKEQKV